MRAVAFKPGGAFKNRAKGENKSFIKIRVIYFVLCVKDNRDSGCCGVIIGSREPSDRPTYFSAPVISPYSCNIMLLGD